jgi:hypothetical protein
VFESGVLRKMFGTKRVEVISGLYMRSVMIYTFHQTLLPFPVAGVLRRRFEAARLLRL